MPFVDTRGRRVPAVFTGDLCGRGTTGLFCWAGVVEDNVLRREYKVQVQAQAYSRSLFQAPRFMIWPRFVSRRGAVGTFALRPACCILRLALQRHRLGHLIMN